MWVFLLLLIDSLSGPRLSGLAGHEWPVDSLLLYHFDLVEMAIVGDVENPRSFDRVWKTIDIGPLPFCLDVILKLVDVNLNIL